MRLYTMFLSVGALLNGLEAAAQDQQLGHEQAIAAIRKLGGEVIVHAKKPDRPVAVVLTGSGSPADCLPYLKQVSNLHTCDF